MGCTVVLVYDREVLAPPASRYHRAALCAALAVLTAPLGTARGQPGPAGDPPAAIDDAAEAALTQKIAVWRIDSLGLAPELVTRLETLFRMELDRLAAEPLPGRREVERALAGQPALLACSGDDRCLAAIGARLEVEVVVAGTVAAMGDSYILNIKAVDVASGKQLRRIATEPLRGSPDELIDAIRVAAYRLLAPDRLHGSLIVLSDLIGAAVMVDGERVGMTPLPGPIPRLSLGPHVLRVEATGYQAFEDQVEIRFQKASRATVRLASVAGTSRPVSGQPITIRRRPWYSSRWAYLGVGVAALGAGLLIGRELGRPTIVDCGKDACQ